MAERCPELVVDKVTVATLLMRVMAAAACCACGMWAGEWASWAASRLDAGVRYSLDQGSRGPWNKCEWYSTRVYAAKAP